LAATAATATEWTLAGAAFGPMSGMATDALRMALALLGTLALHGTLSILPR
jgi:hypothetical protein